MLQQALAAVAVVVAAIYAVWGFLSPARRRRLLQRLNLSKAAESPGLEGTGTAASGCSHCAARDRHPPPARS
jgi:hypothetical protein